MAIIYSTADCYTYITKILDERSKIMLVLTLNSDGYKLLDIWIEKYSFWWDNQYIMTLLLIAIFASKNMMISFRNPRNCIVTNSYGQFKIILIEYKLEMSRFFFLTYSIRCINVIFCLKRWHLISNVRFHVGDVDAFTHVVSKVCI